MVQEHEFLKSPKFRKIPQGMTFMVDIPYKILKVSILEIPGNLQDKAPLWVK